MKVKVDQDLCIACGICEGDLPEVFHIGDSGFAEVIMCPVEADFHDMLQQVAEACPTAAIQIKEAKCSEQKAETPKGPCCGADASKPIEDVSTNTNPERNVNMKIKVVEDLCIGCGICEGIAPEVFSLETEPYAVVLLEAIPEELQADVREAADACPEAAIEIEE